MAASKSISASGNATSDNFGVDAEAVKVSAMIKADNDGTPASGDIVTVYVQGSYDGTLYTTVAHAVPRATLDTNDEDPAVSDVIPIDPAFSDFKIYCENGSSGRAITVSGEVSEIKPDGSGGITKTNTALSWT